MVRYISDQNKLVLIHESGTYASTSGTGQWLGQVMSHDPVESEGLIETRFMGGSSRNWMVMEQGPRDYTGKFSYRAQDLRLLGFAMGSITNTSGLNSTHVFTEINTDVLQSAYASGVLNPVPSFTLEDSKQAVGTGKNFIRTINGCVVDTFKLNLKQNQPVTGEVDYIAQTMTISSGASTAVVQNSNRPYLWTDSTITLGGSVLPTVKDVVFTYKNKAVAPHYQNGSRVISVPMFTNRDYELDLTLDIDSESAKAMYEQFFLGGSTFNVSLDMNADAHAGVTGSQHATISMSGCRVFDPTASSANEGVGEMTVNIRPQTVSVTVYDRVPFYGPY